MATLAETITRGSSFQTYVTIKLLVDKPLVLDCFKAYAYFRWLDDEIDIRCKTRKKRLDFIKRQKHIIQKSYLNKPLSDLTAEEKMIVALVSTNRNKKSKLGSFILNFFRIIEFDAYRKNTLISQKELTWYSKTLSIAVTDGIEYFINHRFSYPASTNHYRAGIGAHITHMLRDYHEDIPDGFVNIPKEYLQKHQLSPTDVGSPAFRNWVINQVTLARQYFRDGKTYIAALPVLKGKIAAYWYCARFESVLDVLEKDSYTLRFHYSRQSNLANYFRIIWVTIQATTNHIFHPKAQVTS